MLCLEYIRRLETQASNHDGLSTLFKPCFTNLKEALPLLERTLQEIQGDEATSAEFQEALTKAVVTGDFSSRNLSILICAYSRTHNDPNAPGVKPIVALSQSSMKVLGFIEDILRIVCEDLFKHSNYLKNAVDGVKQFS